MANHLICASIRSIQALFQLGDSSALACSIVDVAAQGFFACSPLPAQGLSHARQPLLTLVPSGAHLSYDIIGLTYWMLARCEEIGPNVTLLDHHGRFRLLLPMLYVVAI